MSLAEYEPITQEVTLNRKAKVTLRGIGADALIKLFTHNFEDISQAYELFKLAHGAVFTERHQTDFLLALVQKVPTLVAEVISLAAGEPAMVHKAAELPLAAQIECLAVIVELTLEESGGLKNLMASLAKIKIVSPAAEMILKGSLPLAAVTESLRQNSPAHH
jgi:hypothetical protein